MLWGVPLVMFVSHTTSHHANVWNFMLQALLCHFYKINGCSTKSWLHHIHYMASHIVSIYARLWYCSSKAPPFPFLKVTHFPKYNCIISSTLHNISIYSIQKGVKFSCRLVAFVVPFLQGHGVYPFYKGHGMLH